MKTQFKRIFFAAIVTYIILTAISCNEATNKDKCLESVKRTFPNAKIYRKEYTAFVFLVIDSTGVREVKTLNMTDPNISEVTHFILAE